MGLVGMVVADDGVKIYEHEVGAAPREVWRGLAERCPFCGKAAIVPLAPSQLAAQPDETSHVCHPGLGGCNQGFAKG